MLTIFKREINTSAIQYLEYTIVMVRDKEQKTKQKALQVFFWNRQEKTKGLRLQVPSIELGI